MGLKSMDVRDNKVLELFGLSTRAKKVNWAKTLKLQQCPFTNSKCYKIRKSQPDLSIGTCTVRYGTTKKDVVICPNRMLERNQVFMDCIHLLSRHEPGNELHIVPEVSIPGGSVDYFLVSARDGKPKDFVAIEFQTLDTTGTIWPERQRLLRTLGIAVARKDAASKKGFGMNWKMTAKTILVQLHHKVDTLEHIGKRLVLVIQNHLLDYLRREFNFAHLADVRVGDTMHIHSYKIKESDDFRLALDTRISTDASGVARALGIQATTKIELETILADLERKMSKKTLLTLESTPSPIDGQMPTE
jgi:hypothetical protein